jgi:hypothetical protein
MFTKYVSGLTEPKHILTDDRYLTQIMFSNASFIKYYNFQ